MRRVLFGMLVIGLLGSVVATATDAAETREDYKKLEEGIEEWAVTGDYGPFIGAAYDLDRSSFQDQSAAQWQNTRNNTIDLVDQFGTAEQADLVEDAMDAVEAGDEAAYEEALEALLEDAGFEVLGLAGVQPASLPGQPNASSTRVSRNLMTQTVFSQAVPDGGLAEPTGGEGVGIQGRLGTDMFVDWWEFDSGSEGTTYGINPSFVWGEKTQVSLTVPVYYEDPDHVGSETWIFGGDVRLKHFITDNFALGGHANVLDRYNSDAVDEHQWSVTGGPFLSYTLPLSDRFSLSTGGLLDVTEQEDVDDLTWLAAAGANLGVKLTDNIAVNPYAIYFVDLDPINDKLDDDYVDVGVDLSANLTETWSITLGVKTTLAHDDYESQQVYLGTAWSF